MHSSHRTATAGGLLAVLLWSTTIAVSRSAAESLGTVTSAAVLLGGAGILGLLTQVISYRGCSFLSLFSRRYLLVCGGLFVLYETALYLAIGLASDGRQVLAVGLINYLWIPFTQLLSVPLLKKKASPLLLPGMLLASGGAALAVLAGAGNGLSLPAAGQGAVFIYGLGLFCGISWALYSNCSRLLGGTASVSAVPLFLAASAIPLLLLRAVLAERTVWSPRAGGEAAYMVIFPTLLGYVLWDAAMRRGNMVLVTAAAYFIPVAATVIAGAYLGVQMGMVMWAACAMVTAGAFVTRYSIRENR